MKELHKFRRKISIPVRLSPTTRQLFLSTRIWTKKDPNLGSTSMHTVKSAANLSPSCQFSPRNELSRRKQFFRTTKLACKQKCQQMLNLPYRFHGTKFISRFHVRTHDNWSSCKFPFNLIIAYVTFTHKFNTGRSNLLSSTRIDA